MPREDVPYPGRAICSIKERIEEIADEVDEKIETINGVGGNGAGNVTIFSETPAILVNSDAAQNQIGLDFDVSQVVTSVNNQTGDVTLDAGDVLGTDDLGNAGTPIYLSGGNAAACTVDASPTSGSSNLVTSGGVYDAIKTPIAKLFSVTVDYTTANSVMKLTFSSTSVTNSDYFSIADSVVTVKKTGDYLIILRITCQKTGDGRVEASICRNTTSEYDYSIQYQAGNVNCTTTLVCRATFDANDTIYAEMWSDTTALTRILGTTFDIIWLG